MQNRQEFTPKEKKNMLLSQETLLGIRITGRVTLHIHDYLVHHVYYYFSIVKSFTELTRFVFTIPGIKVFLSEKISQDPLEQFFGCQRQRGSTSENPTVAEFCKNTQALRVINTVCGEVSKGNCRGNTRSLDTEKENKPLPKRRRHHK